MTTTADTRLAQLRKELEGNFALSAAAYARGDFSAGANFMRQVNEAREELERLS